MTRNTKNVKNEKCTLQDLEYGKKTENDEKRETQTVGFGILRETVKNVKNEKYTQQDLEYSKKHSKNGK